MVFPKIWGKPWAEIDHTHTESDVTDLDKYTQAEVDAKTWTESDITDLDKYSQAEADAKFLPINEDAILTENGTYEGKTATVTVDDASAAFGNCLYLAADFHYERAKADSDSTMPVTALALESGAGSKTVLKRGQICNTSWNWSAGAIYASPDTTGGFTQDPDDFDTTGHQAQIVGYALSADTMWFEPELILIEIA